MKITDELRIYWIAFTKLEEEDYNYLPAIEVKIEVKTKYIDCYSKSVWLVKDEIDKFIQALQILDEKREGMVELPGLQDISSDKLHLSIQAIDKWGHLAVIIRINYLDSPFKDMVQTGFEIDPSSIPQIIVGLKRLKS